MFGSGFHALDRTDSEPAIALATFGHFSIELTLASAVDCLWVAMISAAKIGQNRPSISGYCRGVSPPLHELVQCLCWRFHSISEFFCHSNGYYAPSLDRTDSSQYVEAPCEVLESFSVIFPSMKSFRWAMMYQSPSLTDQVRILLAISRIEPRLIFLSACSYTSASFPDSLFFKKYWGTA
jgi:hypothetical protein